MLLKPRLHDGHFLLVRFSTRLHGHILLVRFGRRLHGHILLVRIRRRLHGHILLVQSLGPLVLLLHQDDSQIQQTIKSNF